MVERDNPVAHVWLGQAPGPAIPLAELYLDLDWGDPAAPIAVAIGMVGAVDGGATVAGVSGGLGGIGDKQAFRRLREAADVILVGAGTVRAEDYGPRTVVPEAGRRRVAAGRPEQPELAILTASLNLDLRSRVFGDPARRPVIVTHAGADPARRGQLEGVASAVVDAGAAQVDLHAVLDRLRERGHRRVLVEGGPSLNGQLLAAGLVDELFVTLAPALTGSGGRRLVEGELPDGRVLTLKGAVRVGDELLLRYGVAGPLLRSR